MENGCSNRVNIWCTDNFCEGGEEYYICCCLFGVDMRTCSCTFHSNYHKRKERKENICGIKFIHKTSYFIADTTYAKILCMIPCLCLIHHLNMKLLYWMLQDPMFCRTTYVALQYCSTPYHNNNCLVFAIVIAIPCT